MAAPPRSARAPGVGISPVGLRAGDPATCEALCERRGAAVLAYCRHVAEPGAAVAAAAESFARFRAAVIAIPEGADVDPDLLLLSATRHAAAEHAPRPARTRIATQLGAGHRRPQACALVPELLAARAEDLLSDADRLRLTRHLQSCRSCEEAQRRFGEAEGSYRNPPDAPPDAAASAAIVSALTAGAPAPDGADATAAHLPPEAAAEPAGAGTVEPLDADPGPDWPTEPPVVTAARPVAPAPRSGDAPRRMAVIIDDTLGEDIATLRSTLDEPRHEDPSAAAEPLEAFPSPDDDADEFDDGAYAREPLPRPHLPGAGAATTGAPRPSGRSRRPSGDGQCGRSRCPFSSSSRRSSPRWRSPACCTAAADMRPPRAPCRCRAPWCDRPRRQRPRTVRATTTAATAPAP